MKLILAVGLAVGMAAAQNEHEKKEPAHVPATEHAAGGAEHGSGAGHPQGPSDVWKWANFALLAGGLGYLINKNAGPFFEARSKRIKKEMLEAAAARKDADLRAAEVEQRLANLEAEVATLRAESQKETAAEAERLTQQAAAEIAKIQAHAEQEIVSAGKAARGELKRYSAHLAVGLAEQKVRARMTPDTQEDLVQSFLHNLK
jgi:F-type H+-transporting ATPase subunit b